MSNQHRGSNEDSAASPPGFDLSQANYQSLVNALPLSLLVKDLEGRRLYANQAYLQRRGQTLGDVIGKRDEDLFPPEIARRYSEDDQRVIDSGLSLQDIEESVDREGNTRWIERVKSPIVDSHDKIVGVQLLFWDVTDRVSNDRDLKNERRLLGTLMRNIPDCIYFKDADSRFLRISDAMAENFGLSSADDAIGKTDADIFTDEHALAAREDEVRIMRTREPVVDQVERETWPDREDTWCMSTKMPLVDDEGKVVGTFGISRDITELKRYEDELRHARDAADAANRAKSDFLANMSHEIRTPMNAVIGMSELLAQTELNHEQHDYVKLVRESADSLLQLLNEILDFSKIESRMLELESIPFSLRDVIEKTGQTLGVQAAEKGLELACRVAPDLPDRMMGDPGRLRQVMINLIGNAIKFTDEGEILVEVCNDTDVEAVEPDWLPLRFSVRDTGIGIPENLHAAVLDPFTQADASTTRRFGGTGLGLAISRQLVELMHGELQLDSQPGFGANFFFTAHFAAAAGQSASEPVELQTLEELPVLLVDDNPTNLRILNEIFSRWKLRPTLADRGDQALEEIGKAKRLGHPFRLAILDCMMPGMDGFQLAERIRGECTTEEIKLIILSSASRGDDVRRCRQLEIARYMTKPVVQSELLDTVMHVMHAKMEPEIQQGESLPSCPPMRILVAEDGLANQHVAVGMLRAGGHQAVVVSDGRETVARWQDEPFDAILMDMHMPVMDGIEATEAIRANERSTGAHIPIIALTAAAMKEDVAACKQAGMDAYLAKPIHLRQLQETLAKFAPEHPVLDSRDNQRAKGTSFSLQPETKETIAPDAASSGCEEPDSDVIDLQAAASRVPGGLPGVRRLAEVFLGECDDLMTALRRDIPGGEPATVRRSAHTLKGSASLFAAQGVQQTAARIEVKASENALEATPVLLVELEQEVEKMLTALRRFLDSPSD
jgi:two-component system sensor histidine kinase/response regulator